LALFWCDFYAGYNHGNSPPPYGGRLEAIAYAL
jgi:hypothetical protein